MANFSLWLTSGILSILSYTLVVLFLILQFFSPQKEVKQYTTYKETSFNVALIEEKQPVITNVQATPKVQEKKVEKIPVKKESASKTANAGLGINKLFAQVDSKKPTPKEALKPQSTNDVVAKKKKAQESSQKEEDTLDKELQQIMSNLDVKQTMSFSAPKGEFDEFYAKIHEILASRWNPMRLSNQYQAEVRITINNKGDFAYKIMKFSGNADFDKALEEFLDIMRQQEFPKFEGGNQTNIIVTFKTEV
ncbi:MAG: TonB C-terminal domain-containing protein [Helicobacter sp.]|nr:TonB C-terminal domain-containing protein [Helicobacter sp.]